MRVSTIALAASDTVPVMERFRVTQWLRLAAVGLILLDAGLAPQTLYPGQDRVIWLTAGFALVAGLADLLARVWPRRVSWVFAGMLMLDAVYFATATQMTGWTTSTLRYAILLHIGAVSLLASYRIGMQLAVWHSLLLFSIRNAISADLLKDTSPPDVTAYGTDDQRLAVFVVVLWLVAISTSTLSAINERELRRRRRDLEALTELAEQIERTDDSSSVARTLLDAAISTYGFPRGVVLASAEGHLPLLASYGLPEQLARRPGRPGTSAVITRAHEQKSTVLVRGVDVTADPWLAHLLPGRRNLVVVPLSTEGRSLGALVLEHTGGAKIERRIVTGLERSASYAALALRNAWLLEQVQRLAATDGLTKIANRRTFEATLEREVARATRSAEHLSLVMVDLDNFKVLNDTHGHQAGDEVLRNVAAALSCECRDFDTAARYGGEEFVVILPGCNVEEAVVIAERLRDAVAKAPSTTPITASAGVATYPSHAADADTLVRAADQALYVSKNAGRDRTTVSAGISADAQVDALLRRTVSERLGRP